MITDRKELERKFLAKFACAVLLDPTLQDRDKLIETAKRIGLLQCSHKTGVDGLCTTCKPQPCHGWGIAPWVLP